jgi:predicted AlkP superfamily pyrophosphatase or phosphodiesterase
MLNQHSLDGICGALCYGMGIAPPRQAAAANPVLSQYIDKILDGKKLDRIFMFNPDAIAQWISEKYHFLLSEVDAITDLQLPLCSVMPSVTPVCFGTMYTGAQPAVHGIREYTKPVIRIDTLFDALVRQGKKAAIIAYGGSSLLKIYREREIDYFTLSNVDEATATATRIIREDKHDFILLYNGNYDAACHGFGPESIQALSELRSNAHNFAMITSVIRECWGNHDTLLGFAMDHGCHEIIDGCGDHGFDLDDDLNIVHRYKILKKSEK